jgi:hypothetical protein
MDGISALKKPEITRGCHNHSGLFLYYLSAHQENLFFSQGESMPIQLHLDGTSKYPAYLWNIGISSDLICSNICIDPSSPDFIIITAPALNSTAPVQIEIYGDDDLKISGPADDNDTAAQLSFGDELTIDFPNNGDIIIEIPRNPSATGGSTIKVKQGKISHLYTKNIRLFDA